MFSRHHRFVLGTLIVPTLVLGAMACGDENTADFPNPTTADVKVTHDAESKSTTAYNPNPFTVALNGNPSITVTWGNDDREQHTVTEDGVTPSFNSGAINPGDTFSHDFTAVGDYTYHCSIHANMVGTIHVDP